MDEETEAQAVRDLPTAPDARIYRLARTNDIPGAFPGIIKSLWEAPFCLEPPLRSVLGAAPASFPRNTRILCSVFSGQFLKGLLRLLSSDSKSLHPPWAHPFPALAGLTRNLHF